jgi:hypothetical protein
MYLASSEIVASQSPGEHVSGLVNLLRLANLRTWPLPTALLSHNRRMDGEEYGNKNTDLCIRLFSIQLTIYTTYLTME